MPRTPVISRGVHLTKSPVGIRSGSDFEECAPPFFQNSNLGRFQQSWGSHDSYFHCSPVFDHLFPLFPPIASYSSKSPTVYSQLSYCLSFSPLLSCCCHCHCFSLMLLLRCLQFWNQLRSDLSSVYCSNQWTPIKVPLFSSKTGTK